MRLNEGSSSSTSASSFSTSESTTERPASLGLSVDEGLIEERGERAIERRVADSAAGSGSVGVGYRAVDGYGFLGHAGA